MFEYYKARFKAAKLIRSLDEDKAYEGDKNIDANEKITSSLSQNIITLREKAANSEDLVTREIVLNGVNINIVSIEGMVGLQALSQAMLEPLLSHEFNIKGSPHEIFDYLESHSVFSPDTKEVTDYDEIFRLIMSGFAVILIDGVSRAMAFGIQGYAYRSISEPSSEINERGSHEGFTEPIKVNVAMIRRRIKSPKLKFEYMTIGSDSKTDVCLAYMTNKVSKQLLAKIKRRLSAVKLETVITAGYLQPFLEGRPWSLFSDVGVTERPDVLCAKISEGRIAVVVDGVPFSLIVPYLFTENFQSLDDYAHRPYYSSFIRIIKYISFIATILIPGAYVAIGTFHPELLPHALLFNVAASEEITPFPLMIEAIVIHLLYEIMREAGLRMPKAVGHAVSIVGALVIGDAAVSAGLIGAPMVLIVAMTAISSFVVPSLYESVTLLRFSFIILGGTLGLYGIAVALLLLLIDCCSLNAFGSIYTSPISPFSAVSMQDTFIRANFKRLEKHRIKLQNLNGMEINDKEN